MKIEEEVKEMVNNLLVDYPSLFLVGVKMKGTGGNRKLMVWLDGDEGVTIDHCAEISRDLSVGLEERDLVEGSYQLEVSSAGTDHPLQSLRQYKKNVGRSLKVTLKDGKEVSGRLAEVNEDMIRLTQQEKKSGREHLIKFEEIESSKVLVSFK